MSRSPKSEALPRPDPDPLFRFERERPLEHGGRQLVIVSLTKKSLAWVILSPIVTLETFQNGANWWRVLRGLFLP